MYLAFELLCTLSKQKHRHIYAFSIVHATIGFQFNSENKKFAGPYVVHSEPKNSVCNARGGE